MWGLFPSADGNANTKQTKSILSDIGSTFGFGGADAKYKRTFFYPGPSVYYVYVYVYYVYVLRFGGTSVGLGVDGAEGLDAEGGIRACEAAGESGEEGEVAGKSPPG